MTSSVYKIADNFIPNRSGIDLVNSMRDIGWSESAQQYSSITIPS